MIARPCLGCRDVIAAGTYCADCKPPARPKASAASRGYTAAWARLSRTARTQQKFCTDCGRTDEERSLQLDHLPSAWERLSRGLAIRLGTDAEVVCGPCNVRRGPARGPNARQG